MIPSYGRKALAAQFPPVSMEKLHFFNMLLLPFLLQFSSLFLLSSANTPSKYFINCGSNFNVNVGDRSFVGDLNTGSFRVGQSKPIQGPSSSTDTTLYQTARVYRQTSSYDFDITEHGTYMVRLHFFVFKSGNTNLADALFNVSASNILLLSNFSVQKNSSLPVIKEFLLTNINDGKLRIYFQPAQVTSFAFVNAMEVFLAPENYGMSLMGDDPYVTSEGSNGTYPGSLPQVLQTIHRINVGGESVNDTILWRNWITDKIYLLPGSSPMICPDHTGISLKGNEAEASYIGPDEVYKTCREVNLDDDQGSNSSIIAWQFDVNKNSSHLVRAHFCDLISDVINEFNFSLYVYNKFNQTISPLDENIFSTAFRFYYDFVVHSDDSGFMNISIRLLEDFRKAYLNGLEIIEFLKQPGLVPMENKQKNKNLFVIIGSVAGVIVIFILIVAFLCRLKRLKDKLVETMIAEVPVLLYKEGRISDAYRLPNLNLKLIMPFAEILEATHNFDRKNLIGEGGFGKVYKGILGDGIKVAVKRSDPQHGQGLPEFHTEILVLSRIRHRHLVSLIGYCDEGSEMILVYEFMEKGALRDHIYDSNENSERSFTRSKLTWSQRLEICIGSAKGLYYLHSGSDGGIIHRDVKSTNILLDEHYVAKVADFGLSRSCTPDIDEFSLGIKGSFGYLDPEYFSSLQLTEKSDVYSFGVVLLEVLCARPAIMANSTRREEINLAEWGLFWQRKGQLEKIVDPLLQGKINPNSLRKFGEIVEKCLRENGVDRPTMRDVFWDLEYALQLQQTAVTRYPHEDSTKDALLPLELDLPISWHLPFNDLSVQDQSMVGNDISLTTDTEMFVIDEWRQQSTVEGG